jgi:hypothetical protein
MSEAFPPSEADNDSPESAEPESEDEEHYGYPLVSMKIIAKSPVINKKSHACSFKALGLSIHRFKSLPRERSLLFILEFSLNPSSLSIDLIRYQKHLLHYKNQAHVFNCLLTYLCNFQQEASLLT